jgi:hypothetical protein
MSTARASNMSAYEIRSEGWRALTDRLGVSGAIRFLMQYDPGRGDYTSERREILADLTLDDALRRIKDRGLAP